jgi:heme-degrading monooxygenase HmoA
MVVGIIEFHIRPGLEARYDEVAAQLHAHIQTIDGFISVERFESRTNEGKLLSVSYWEDEAALKRWRDDADHQAGMKVGREEVFQDYRIIVAEVQRDYAMARPDQPA